MSFDQVIKESCPECGNETFKNNFLLREGHHARVFVECAACGAFVARYIIHAYVDPRYDLSSMLTMLRVQAEDESWRGLKRDLKIHQDRARTQFSDMQRRLIESDKEREGLPAEERYARIMELIYRHGIQQDG